MTRCAALWRAVCGRSLVPERRSIRGVVSPPRGRSFNSKGCTKQGLFRLGCCRFRIRELVSQWSKWNREICHEERRPSRRLPIGVGAAQEIPASVGACRSELKGAGDCGEIRLELCRNLGDEVWLKAAYRGGCQTCQNLPKGAIRHSERYHCHRTSRPANHSRTLSSKASTAQRTRQFAASRLRRNHRSRNETGRNASAMWEFRAPSHCITKPSGLK